MPRIPDACASVFCPPVKKTAFAFRPVALAVFILLSFIFYQSSVNKALAQSATATLSGVITDPAGSVVAGANVAVISIAQGFMRSTTSNSEGIFIVPLLPPGNYTVKVEHEGFNPFES